VGAFYQPATVLIDPLTLDTLTPEIFADGLAEAVKYAFIRDKELLPLFDGAKNNILEIIERCVTIKRNVVANDEFDKGERMILNFGHTVGHTIEKAGDYTQYTHGQAVALGMVTAAEISRDFGYCDNVALLKEVLIKNNLPVKTKFSAAGCLKYIANDKKMDGKELNAVLISEIGNAVIKKMPAGEFIKAAEKSTIFNS
jgi:3-dehydroquinate synthase